MEFNGGSTDLPLRNIVWLHQNFFILRQVKWTWCSLSTGPICLTLQHCSTKPRIDAVISCTCVVLDLAGSSKIFNENSNAWIAWIHQWYWNSYYNLILQKFTEIHTIPIDSTRLLGHCETSRCQASARVWCLGTLEAESNSYGEVLKWLSIVYWQLCLGLYSVYACLYNFKIFQIYINVYILYILYQLYQ